MSRFEEEELQDEPIRKQKNQKIERKCLNCQKNFQAPNKIVRLCKNCRILPKYKYGTMHEGGDDG